MADRMALTRRVSAGRTIWKLGGGCGMAGFCIRAFVRVRIVGGSVQCEGPYNRYQARQLERVAQMQQQLDEQKRKLDRMQEAARHAGMHTAVYDP